MENNNKKFDVVLIKSPRYEPGIKIDDDIINQYIPNAKCEFNHIIKTHFIKADNLLVMHFMSWEYDCLNCEKVSKEFNNKLGEFMEYGKRYEVHPKEYFVKIEEMNAQKM